MCTAVGYQTKDFYFGRTLDYDFSYGEEITIVPRRCPLKFRHQRVLEEHHAIMGVAHIADDYPLFYDAVNEKGLAVAGLNFVGNARYYPAENGRVNVAQFEFIPWILSQCDSVADAKRELINICITEDAFSQELPPAQLHWLIADSTECITVESTEDGLNVYDNPVGVLTNNPIFPMQLFSLNQYMGLSSHDPKNSFFPELPLQIYSRGMGGIGLPGDLSSQSRFIRAAFSKCNSKSQCDEKSSVSQFFHILGSVSQTRGLCTLPDGNEEITIYTSCYNCGKDTLYYNCYDRHEITALDMHKEDLDGQKLIRYPMLSQGNFIAQN